LFRLIVFLAAVVMALTFKLELVAAGAELGEAVKLETADEGSVTEALRPISTRSMAHLYDLMARQSPLLESDLIFYEKNAACILALNDAPEALSWVIAELGVTEARFIYVVTKVGLGLLQAAGSNYFQFHQIPDFAWPNQEETALIAAHLDQLTKALSQAEPAFPEVIDEQKTNEIKTP
jgi:hypothetical protein